MTSYSICIPQNYRHVNIINKNINSLGYQQLFSRLLQHIISSSISRKFHPTNEKALWLTDLRLFEVNGTRCWSPETVCKGHHFLLFQQIRVMIQLPTHLFLTCNWHQPWRTLNRDLEEEDGGTCRLKLGLGRQPRGNKRRKLQLYVVMLEELLPSLSITSTSAPSLRMLHGPHASSAFPWQK
ncbi:unnamed protein product [Musa textilis]